MRIFDTHAHYDEKAFDQDREILLGSMRASGVEGIANMGASLDGAFAGRDLAEAWENVYFAAGLHPDCVGEWNPESREQIAALCHHPKCVAVGEIGLDYHWNVESREVQRARFIDQLRLAKELSLPVNIHSRDAAQETFDIMKAEHAGSDGGIIHCYSGSAEMAAEYVKMGYMIGIGGIVTFKNARVIREVAARIPAEAIVTETDCPYLAPEPFRGKRCDSTMIRYVIARIAELKQMDEEELSEILFQNALRVYRIGQR